MADFDAIFDNGALKMVNSRWRHHGASIGIGFKPKHSFIKKMQTHGDYMAHSPRVVKMPLKGAL
jgi:hypothetical protein